MIERIVLSFLLIFSSGGILYKALGLNEIGVSVLLIVCLSLVTTITGELTVDRFNKTDSKKRTIISLTMCIFALLTLIILRKGFLCYLNQLALVFTGVTGRIHLGYDVSGISVVEIQLFSAVSTMILSLIITLLKNRKLRLLILNVLHFALIAMGIAKPDEFFLLFIVTTIVSLFYENIKECSNSVDRPLLKVIVTTVLVCILISAASVTKLYYVADVGAARDFLEDIIHSFKYEEDENPMPEGNLNKAEGFYPSEEIALKIQMSKWEGTYLKGYVGEVYEENQWKKGNEKSYIENRGLFYWLHQNGFYGQSQMVSGLNTVAITKTDEMTIKILNGCKQYTYIPYSLNQDIRLIADAKVIGDLNIVNNGEQDNYNLYYVAGALKNSYVTQKKIKSQAAGDKEEVRTYLNNESAYRDSVYKNYLDIPAETEELFKEVLGERKKLTTTKAKTAILNYMQSNIIYSEDGLAENEEKDVVSAFIKGKHGYSVHYATAATLIMRYYGIPARYVEGYIVTSDAIKSNTDSDYLDVTQQYAHAWTEYYLDGVGWIPFETTPQYLKENIYTLTGNADIVSGGAELTPAAGQGNSENGNDEKPKANLQQSSNKLGSIFVIKWLWLLMGLLILIIAVSFITVARRRRLMDFIATFQGEDKHMAVQNAFAYSIGILNKALTIDTTFPRENQEQIADYLGAGGLKLYNATLKINEKSRYGSILPTAADVAQVLEFKDLVIATYSLNRKGVKRMYDKFIKNIY